jgi:hypothetical protein
MVEVTESFLQQFVDGLKESAAAQRESAGAQQASASAQQATAVELRALTEETRNGRKDAVQEVMRHVTTELKTELKLSNRWPSILLGTLTALATLAVGILGLIAARAGK